MTAGGLSAADGGADGGGADGGSVHGGGATLARRYRRLLLAYPRSYRRSHGSEILTTLMDAAMPGRDRPSRRDVRDLLLGGLRQRFRLPVGRSMVFVAVVSALVLGAFGSATGSALCWATAPAAPNDATVRTIVDSALGQPFPWSLQRDSQVFGLRPRAVAGRMIPPGWTVAAARERLIADGWRIGPVESRPSQVYQYDTDETITGTDHTFIATRDGTAILVAISEIPGEQWHGMVLVQAARPWSVVPLMLVGLVVGLLGGWLLTARVGYRVRRLRPLLQMPHIVTATVAIAALGVSVLPSFHALGENIALLREGPFSPDRFGGAPPFPAFPDYAPLDVLSLTGLGALVVLIALTCVPRKRTALGGTSGSAEGSSGIPYAA